MHGLLVPTRIVSTRIILPRPMTTAMPFPLVHLAGMAGFLDRPGSESFFSVIPSHCIIRVGVESGSETYRDVVPIRLTGMGCGM